MDKQKTKQDLMLLLGILLAALAVWGVWALFNRGEAQAVVVSQDGKETARYPLMEDDTITIPCDGGGYNLLVISAGEASVSDADCPDRLCVGQRAISKKGDSIICLPHRLVVSIDSGEEGGLDAVTY